jgi:hypothetical protein
MVYQQMAQFGLMQLSFFKRRVKYAGGSKYNTVFFQSSGNRGLKCR